MEGKLPLCLELSAWHLWASGAQQKERQQCLQSVQDDAQHANTQAEERQDRLSNHICHFENERVLTFSQRKPPVTKLSCPPSGLRLYSRPQETHTSLGNEAYTTHTWQPTTRPISDTPQQAGTPAEDTFANTQTHGEMLVIEEFFLLFCILPFHLAEDDSNVDVQGYGRPNQRTRNRARLCLRYQTFHVLTNLLFG